MKNTLVINDSNIQDKIYTIRGAQVMLDRGLAEFANLRSKNLTLKNHRDKYNPKLFTKQGVSIFKVVEFDHFKNLSTLKEYIKYNFLTYLFHLSMKCQRKGLLYE